MTCELAKQSYGKSRVRLSRIARREDRHDFIELTIWITLEGDFGSAYTDGDNEWVIPTDTMKNTVYALAESKGVDSPEGFSMTLAHHFVDNFSHVDSAEIRIHESPWSRIESTDGAHPHAFLGGGSEHATCVARVRSNSIALESGITGLQVLKTTDSSFTGFLKDKYTTLTEATDRIFATSITANWPCPDRSADWTLQRRMIRAAMLETFANRHSPSVQATLFDMAGAIFLACATIDEITISMPNQHHVLADLEQFGLQNGNHVFVPMSEPFGVISATVKRGAAS